MHLSAFLRLVDMEVNTTYYTHYAADNHGLDQLDELPDQEGGVVDLSVLAGVGRESYGLGVGLRATKYHTTTGNWPCKIEVQERVDCKHQ